jgi:hypothetical protein
MPTPNLTLIAGAPYTLPGITASWSVLTNIVFTNALGQFIDPAANVPQKFYRAVVP